MSDPAVTAYVTKLLCSYGGRMQRNQLVESLNLPAEQIEQILQNEPLKFPQSHQLVLARNSLRICTKYLNPKEEEEKEQCLKLHLCRDYLRGLCPPNRRPRCRFSHDAFSDHNCAVLKAHELSGLIEEEIKVLLFQNDHQLLPENCRKYMRNNCDQGEDCTRLHVCFYFMRGECNNCACKKSHNLLESKELLTCSWLNQETIQNFQMICVLKHNERQQVPREEPRNEEVRGVRGKSRGRRRPRGGRGARSQDMNDVRSKERRERSKGPRAFYKSESQQPSQYTRGRHLEDNKNDSENDYDDRKSERRLNSLMEEWFSPNPESTDDHEFLSAPFSIPNKPSDAPILSHKSVQPQTHAPYSTEKTRTEVSNQVWYSNSLNTHRKEVSLHQTSVFTAPNKPTLNSVHSTASPRPLTTSSTLINSSSGGPSTQLNPSIISSKSENYFSPSTLNQIPVKKLSEKECSPVAEPAKPKPIPSIKPRTSLGSTSENPSISKPKPVVFETAVQSDSHLLSTRSQHIDDEYVENYYNDTYSETKLNNIMEWFNQNTASSYAHAPNKPTLKSGQSTTSTRPLTTSSTLINSSSGGPSTKLKPVTGSARLPSPPTVSSTSTLTSNKLRGSSVDPSFTPEPSIVPSFISAKSSLVSSKSETFSSPSSVAKPANAKPFLLGSTSESPSKVKLKPAVSAVASHLESPSSLLSISDFSSTSIGAYRRPIIKPEAASVIKQPLYDLTYLKPKLTNSNESKSQQTIAILCATPQKCNKTLDELATWTNNGQPNAKKVSSSISSSELKTVYHSNPTKTVPVIAENQKDTLSQKIKQVSDSYQAERHSSPRFPDIAELKVTSGSIKYDANKPKADSPLKGEKYPPTWYLNAVPEVGYQNILLFQTSDEFINVTKMFNKTVQGYTVQKVWRVQNPTLLRAYERQKHEMKNSGIDVHEWQLFHGTDSANITTICRDNFDWCVCGTKSIMYGQGNCFARDASFANSYSPTSPAGTKTMFVARVLVGDFVEGEPTMRHSPQKHRSPESYRCCVNSVTNPSIFVMFEKSQAYPEYVLEYKMEKKSACNIS